MPLLYFEKSYARYKKSSDFKNENNKCLATLRMATAISLDRGYCREWWMLKALPQTAFQNVKKYHILLKLAFETASVSSSVY